MHVALVYECKVFADMVSFWEIFDGFINVLFEFFTFATQLVIVEYYIQINFLIAIGILCNKGFK